jgi:hypothetical protein
MHFLMPRSAPAAVFFLLTAAGGLLVSIYLYRVPLTGVTGSLGAQLVIGSCAAMVLAGLVLTYRPWGRFPEILRYLCLFGAVGTLAAAWFLHANWLLGLMVLATVFILFDFLAESGEPG